MNLSNNRPTDEQIVNALKANKTQLEIINHLGTHSQRIMHIKRKYGIVAEVKTFGYGGGSKVNYIQSR